MQGFEFICDIISIISNNQEKRSAYKRCRDSGKRFDNKMKEILVSDWTILARNVLQKSRKEEEEIVNYYQRVSSSKKDLQIEVMSAYEQDVFEQFDHLGEKKTLSNKFNNIFVNQKVSTPGFFFGLAMTIALAVERYKDDNFYIGIEEAKQLLFKSMEVLGYVNVECISDECAVSGEKNMRNLLFAALYHAFLVMLPYHQEHRENNYNQGRNIIQKVINSDSDSRLYYEIKQATETGNIVRILWDAQDKFCKKDMIFNIGELPIERFYCVPSIKGEIEYYKILSCDDHFRVRSFVEGKDGSGKSCLAKAITLACRKKVEDPDMEKRISKEIGLERRVFLPIFVDCIKLDFEEVKSKGIFSSVLDQMYLWANQVSGETDRTTLAHFFECKENILQYCRRKAQKEELLLLIDGICQMGKSHREILLGKMNELCVIFPNLHIVVFSKKLKQSEMRMLPRYSNFKIEEFQHPEELITKMCQNNERAGTITALNENEMLKNFINTPRKIFFYIKNSSNKDFHKFIPSCVEEEIDNKGRCSVQRDVYKMFLMHLLMEALEKRNNEMEFVIPEKIINKSFFGKLDGIIDDPEKIWEDIEKKSILIERSEYINSFQFNNKYYFCSIIADYCIDILEKCDQKECCGTLMYGFSKLSAWEFSMCILLILYKIGDTQNSMFLVQISEENLSLFFNIITGILFSYIKKTDIAFGIDALEQVINNQEWSDAFLVQGQYSNRMCLIKKMQRVYQALVSIRDSLED